MFDNSTPVLPLTSLPPLPLLVTALDVSLFLSRKVHARWSAARWSPECPKRCQDTRFPSLYLPPPHRSPPPSFPNGWHRWHRPQPGLWSTWRCWPHLHAAVVKKASGCINKGAKWEGGPEAEQTRWRWSSPGFTLCLQLQGFFCGPVVGLLHQWSATSTPEVRPQALKCYLDFFYILKKQLFFHCHLLFQHCVCLRGGTTHWVKAGWTLVCSAPVCTLSASVAAGREYTNNLVSLAM